MELEQKRWEIYSSVLASTGISLVYSKEASTASYDLASKTVVLPVWEFLDETATQALASHEIGHARHSDYPLSAFAEYAARYRDLFNVVEDARIERLMKMEFRGLSGIFKAGYSALAKEGIFSLEGIEDAPLVERLNVFAKFGFMKDVPFSKEESPFAYRIINLSTKTDVVDLCEDILSYLKESADASSIQKQTEGKGNASSNGMERDGADGAEAEGELNESEGQEGFGSGEGCRTDGEDDGDGSEDFSGLEQELTDSRMREMERFIEQGARSRGEARGRSPEKASETVIMNSKKILDAVLAPAGVDALKSWSAIGNVRKRKAYADIAEKAAQSAASLFVQKRSAMENAGRRRKTVGRIDARRLAHYSTSDAIFRQIEKMPKGQSHGVVLLLDYSSSMTERNSILRCACLQAAILARFCQLVDIPFSIYLYGCLIEERNGWNRSTDWQIIKIADSSWADVNLIVALGFTKAVSQLKTKSGVSFRYGRKMLYVHPGHNTPTIEAMVAARRDILEMKRSGIEKPVIFVVSDGAHNIYVQAKMDGCSPSLVSDAREIRLDMKPYGVKDFRNIDSGALECTGNIAFELLCGYLKKETGTAIVCSSIASSSRFEWNADYWRKAAGERRIGTPFTERRSFVYDVEPYLFKHAFIFGEDVPESVLKSIERNVFTEARLQKDTLADLFLMMNAGRTEDASQASASLNDDDPEAILAWIKASNELLRSYRQLAVSFVNFFA